VELWSWPMDRLTRGLRRPGGCRTGPQGARRHPSEHVWKWFAISRPTNLPKFTGLVQLRRFALLALLAPTS